MNIGIRAHDIENLPLEDLVKRISEKELTAVQLALGKSLQDVATGLGNLSPGMGRYVRGIFARYNI
ncbi:hypothetical protein [Paraliobacillus sediminis]|uniref:hypothetical protein n=1 Tax=Paraliobacillus sediminis TaxID=1885916 RepID=UPI001F071722|nr:hypothetical protein [Paraliobacillus sediminis]